MSSVLGNVLRRAVPALCVIGLTRCTLLSDFAVEQCSASVECDVGTGEVRHCEKSRCVPGCSDNAHCVSVDPRFPLCQRVGGKCVALVDAAEECSVASGYDEQELAGLTLESVDVVGAFGPTARSSSWLSLELGANDWNAARRELVSAPLRPLIVVLCKDASESVSRMLPHLVEELGARALVAPSSESALRAALEPSAARAPVFVLSPGGSSLSPQSIDGGGELLWYLGSRDSDTLPAYAPLLERGIPSARSRAADAADFHLASVVGDRPEDDALSRAVREMITVDGRDAGGLIIDDRLRIVDAPHELHFDPTQGLERLLDPVPNLVLLFMGAEEDPTVLDAATIVELLETQAASRGVSPPLYLLGPRSLEDATLQALVAARPSLRSRVVGVRADRIADPALALQLQQRYEAAYPALSAARPMAQSLRPPTQRLGPLRALAPVYDALYLLAYGLFAAPRAEPVASAADVLAGFRRVTDPAAGEPIEIGPGPERLEQGLRLLQSGATLQLAGPSGPDGFDAIEHTRSGPPRLYVISSDGQLLDTDPAAVFDAASSLPD